MYDLMYYLFICLLILFIYFFIFFSFLGPHMWHMEVPRPEIELKLQLPAYTTARAMLESRPTERGQESNLHPHGY